MNPTKDKLVMAYYFTNNVSHIESRMIAIFKKCTVVLIFLLFF